ncbi:MAG: ribose-phosphate diphosphokinase [Patescibacteria group bacterium]
MNGELRKKVAELYRDVIEPDLWRERMLLFSAGGNDGLAQEIAEILTIPLNLVGGFFSDTDVKVKFEPNVRGKHVVLIQPTVISNGKGENDGPLSRGRSASDNLMLLMGCCDAFKRASVKELTLVIPCLGGSREDRKSEPHIPIMASVVANMIVKIGKADRVVTIDLHSGQIQGMFESGFPVDNLYAMPLLLEKALDYLMNEGGIPRERIKLGAPDLGVKVLRSLGKKYELPVVQYDKERLSDQEARLSAVIGDVKNFAIILIDDLFTTYGTMHKATEVTYDLEAEIVVPCGVHAIIVPPALRRLEKSRAPVIFASNTVEWRSKNKKPDKLRTVSVAPLLAEVIRDILTYGSVSKHFVGIKD